jgi:hypothetical protein
MQFVLPDGPQLEEITKQRDGEGRRGRREGGKEEKERMSVMSTDFYECNKTDEGKMKKAYHL